MQIISISERGDRLFIVISLSFYPFSFKLILGCIYKYIYRHIFYIPKCLFLYCYPPPLKDYEMKYPRNRATFHPWISRLSWWNRYPLPTDIDIWKITQIYLYLLYILFCYTRVISKTDIIFQSLFLFHSLHCVRSTACSSFI